MKALVYNGPEKLDYQDFPNPSPKEGEVLIQIALCGICGSDMHAYLGHDERRPAPLILGHEVTGTIVSGAKTGQRVAVNPLVPCGECAACQRKQENLCPNRQIISMPPREGGFADYVAMPVGNLVDVPDHVPDSTAALVEPIACGWHAVRLGIRALGDFWNGARALVIGGGAIGTGAALALKAQGISEVSVVEPNSQRAAFLEKSIGLKVLTPEQAEAEQPFDLIIDGVGYAATRQMASASVRPGGVIAHIGLGSGESGLDIRRMTLQEITFIGTYTYTAEDFRETAKAMFDGRLGALDWVEIRPLSKGATAFADLRAGQVASPKILLKPDTTGDKNV
ncbi:alcohol dehydrogenase [Roseibium sp. TrichSKD4]|uniref:zinc-dependent alcohol dehydrogenase n=1 Tax=Roseibium sp. TrichSKD4 TaxID=744980 RepID=UPI0001E56DDB|nr:alcohol dehydrogenase catalytic domain-containing protein [Roseibium sp. TrichSKD4]EFO33304.1 alcohol dehydrogenase [Roseibium sp. TrichSKD4]